MKQLNIFELKDKLTILSKTPCELEDEWEEMNYQIANITNLLKEEIEVLGAEAKKLDSKGKKEKKEQIKVMKQKINNILADNQSKFVKIQLKVCEAAKEKINFLDTMYSNEAIEGILLNFQMYAFDYQYREEYYLKSYSEILEDAIYNYRCELSHCIQISDIVEYMNLTIYKPFKESLQKIQLLINSFLLGDIKTVADMGRVLAYAGNNSFYSKPFQYFTGVKLPWEIKESKLLDFLKKEKTRINAEEVYERRKAIRIFSKKILNSREIAVGYHITLKNYGEFIISAIKDVDGVKMINLESDKNGEMQLSSGDLAKEILWKDDLEQIIGNIKVYSDKEFREKSEYIDFLWQHSSWDFKFSVIQSIKESLYYEAERRGSEKAKILTDKQVLTYTIKALLADKDLVKLFKSKGKIDILSKFRKSCAKPRLLTDGYFVIGMYSSSNRGIIINLETKDRKPISFIWDTIYEEAKRIYNTRHSCEITQISLIELTNEIIQTVSKKQKSKLIEGQMMFSL